MTAKPPATDIPEGFVPLFRTSLFLDALGPFFYRPTKSSFVIGLRVATKHANARGSAHGGLLLTLVDIALGYTGSASSDPPLALTTVEHRRRLRDGAPACNPEHRMRNMAISTGLTKCLGIEHPVMLAPMGFVSGGALAAAVSAGGGFGIIGGGYADPDWLEREFALAGNCPVGCGFITWALAKRPATLDLALSHHPPAIMLSFGDATPFLPKVTRAGALAICQVQSITQARAVLIEGADIIVAQGTEAGGHGGGRSTLPLVPAVVDMIARSGRDVPVVAAGGIADGRGLAAALMLGADGVLMGTRFHVASEALASSAAKARIVAASGDDTIRTTVFDIARGYDWPPQYTGRAVHNRFSETWHGREEALAQDEAERTRYAEAAARGDPDIAVVFASEGIDLIHAIEPASVVLAQVLQEAEAALARSFSTAV